MFKRIPNQNQKGFTIAELTIASAVFSIVLLTAMAGFLQIGHIFYKGVTVTSTQDTAHQIYQDVSGYFQTAETVSPQINPPSSSGYYYYCIGGARFTYNIDYVVDSSQAPDHSSSSPNFGILKDYLPDPSACAVPCDDLAPKLACNIPFKNPQELLGDRMRVLKFDVAPGSQANVFDISMRFAYGDNQVLGISTPGNPLTRYCLDGSQNQQFCSIVDVDGSVLRGFQ